MSSGGCESRSVFLKYTYLYIYEAFRDLNSVSGVSTREQGQHVSDRGEAGIVWFVCTSVLAQNRRVLENRASLRELLRISYF